MLLSSRISKTGKSMDNEVPAAILNEYRQKLSVWQSPRAFNDNFQQLWTMITGAQLFIKPGLTWVREAWCLNKMANVLEAEGIKLLMQAAPDGCIKLNGKDILVEVTEIMPKSRHRSNDYRPESPKWRPESDDVINLKPDQLARLIAEAVKKKALKPYAPRTALLLYLNIGHHFIPEEKERDTILQTINYHKAPFIDVYALSGDNLMKTL